jgi:hypothetical protein
MRRMSQAEPRKETAFSRKTASRPSRTATTPPSEAPTARQKDQVIEANALAGSTSSAETMFGMTALWAGSKNAAPMVSRQRSG